MNPDVKKFDLNATLQKRVGDVQEAGPSTCCRRAST